MSTSSEQVQVSFSQDQLARLRAIAAERGVSLSALIREAVVETYPVHEQMDRLEAVQRMAELKLPVGDWDQLEQESMPAVNPD